MGAQVIDGKGFAAKLRERVGAQAEKFAQAAGRKAGLAVVLVGEDPASQVYVRSKHKATVAANMESFEHRLPADTGEAELLALVERLNADPAVDGILVQLPLPDHLDEQAVIAAISPDKDVDGFHVTNAGRLAVFGAAINSAGPALLLWRPAGTALPPEEDGTVSDYIPMLVALGAGLGNAVGSAMPANVRGGAKAALTAVVGGGAALN